MDTTNLYIRMSDCPEIQAIWLSQFAIAEVYDYCVVYRDSQDDGKYHTGIFVESPSNTFKTANGAKGKMNDVIWIPRQGQLQKIANTCDCTDPMCLHLDFHKWFIAIPNPAPDWTDTFEKIWLAFTMQRIYNKEWDGEKWQTI